VGRGPNLGLGARPYTLVSINLCVAHHAGGAPEFRCPPEEAASTSAPVPLRTYFEVTLPLTKPGVRAGAVFAFIVSFDQFPVSLSWSPRVAKRYPLRCQLSEIRRTERLAAASVLSRYLLAVLVVIGLDRTVGSGPTRSSDRHPRERIIP